MENFIVSARKYRPSLFSEVVGQENVTQTLRNAILSGHLAQSYLFCGPRGVGKTTVARILAKTINCEHISPEGEPCDACASCKTFNENRSFNIHELDAASNNSVDDIRNLIDQIRIPPQVGKYSVYIIDEVHMLSAAAFNAFLKTLEEPPSYAIFIMATTEKQKILPTILSRCQVFDFNRIKVEDIVKYLQYVADKENIQVEPEAFGVIAQKADGALRDALSVFDQLVSFSGKHLTYSSVIKSLNVLDYDYYFSITRHMLEGDGTACLMIFDEILKKGFDAQHFLTGLSSHFRDILVAKDEVTLPLLEVGNVTKKLYLEQARSCPPDFLFQAIDICYQADITYRASKNQRLHVELTLLKISRLIKNMNHQPPKKKTPGKEHQQFPKPGVSRKGGKSTDDSDAASSVPDGQAQEDTRNQKINNGVAEEKSPAQSQVQAPDPEVNTNSGTVVSESSSHRENLSSVNGISATISIKEALNGSMKNGNSGNVPIKKKNEVQESGMEKPFSIDQLNEKWLTYADMMETEKPRFSAALRSHMPVLKDQRTIYITLENKNLKEDFEQNLKPELLGYLKKELDHYGIQLRIDVEKKGSSSRKPYTTEEKYIYLSKKNPGLQQLKQQFDLDFE